MALDITWGAIGKLLLTSLGVYVFLPSALIVRDYVLWKLINAYILNDELQHAIIRLVQQQYSWTSKFSGNADISSKDGEATYTIDTIQVTQEEWGKYHDHSNNLAVAIEKTKLFIHRKSVFLNWMLKHYKQDEINPIQNWIDEEYKRFNTREAINDS